MMRKGRAIERLKRDNVMSAYVSADATVLIPTIALSDSCMAVVRSEVGLLTCKLDCSQIFGPLHSLICLQTHRHSFVTLIPPDSTSSI